MKKNIILFMTDQQRYDSLGCMGNAIVKTPNLDRIAQEGYLFHETYCVSPICVPSRVSLFTGEYVCKNGCISNAKEKHIGLDKGSFFIETLRENGYKIGLSGKNHTFKDEYFDKWFDYREEYTHHGKTVGMISAIDKEIVKYRHSEKREGFLPIKRKNKLSAVLGEGLFEEPEPFGEDQCVTWRIAEDAITFIEENKEQPFFLFCSFPDPHWPTVVCEPYYSMYNIEDIELEGLEIDWSKHPFAHFVQSQVNGYEKYTEEEKKKIVAIYYGMITYIDKAVGKVMDTIEQLSLEDETIIIFCADHGDYAGRYGMVAKTKAFYDSLVRIPLIIKIPGMNKEQNIHAQVSNIDILPTIIDYLGMNIPEGLNGESFLEVLEGKRSTHRTEIFSEVGTPQLPPQPIPFDEFSSHKLKKDQEEGWFWFCDYTVNGRSAMIKKDHLKYCYYTGDKEELYDLSNDPYELINLAEDTQWKEQKEKLKNHLFEWLLRSPMV